MYLENAKITTGNPLKMSQRRYMNESENGVGYCTTCKAEASGVEPDARRYRCESCGAHAVYGLEELLIMGRVEIR